MRGHAMPALLFVAAAVVTNALGGERAAARSANGVVTGTVILEKPSHGLSAEDASLPAIVYIPDFDAPPIAASATMVQKNKAFVPGVLAITQGQSVEFPNSDVIQHNVFSVSPAQSFDLGLAGPRESPRVKFGRTGMVDVHCNIHPEMAGTILVLPNSAYATTASDGTFRIDDIPAGDHTIYVWHRLAKAEHQTIRVKAGQRTEVTWRLKLGGKPPPHLDKHGRPYKQNKKY